MSNREIKLEVCVDSIASALAAEGGGAARIELCSALSEGGLTPTVGILKKLKELPLRIPIFCMLRPRRGSDFVYSDEELEATITDLELLRAHGADGFIFGALNINRTIDVKKCQRIVQKAETLPVTFSRAFDLTEQAKMHETVEQLKEIGFSRILSSGFRQSAADGVEFLAQLIAEHHHDIVIMPGAGIKVCNLEEILSISRCTEFHASAMRSADDDYDEASIIKMECDVTMGKQDMDPYYISDINVVRKMVTIANAMASK